MQLTDNESLVRVLVEDPDPAHRCRAHVELGRRATEASDLDRALVHYAEAAQIDPTDEVAREELERLEQQLDATTSSWRWRVVDRFFGRKGTRQAS